MESSSTITGNGPSDLAIQENAWGLARYARAVQESGLVPIIEPEILMDGNHSIETTSRIQQRVITEVYKACQLNGVYLEGTLLKPSMTVSGSNVPDDGAKIVAKTTVETLLRCVPAAVPGIVFLSGGLSEDQASTYLNEMTTCCNDSFKRALEFIVLIWSCITTFMFESMGWF